MCPAMGKSERQCDPERLKEVKAVVTVADSRDEAEGPLLPEDDAPSDMASFQPPDSDLPSFLEDCNRVPTPFTLFKATE